MRHLVFVAPKFLENTNRFVAGFARLASQGLTVSLISEDPSSAIPGALVPHLQGGHYQVKNPLDGAQLAEACRHLAKHVAPIDRLTGALEQLQLPLALARELTGIPGMRSEHARRFRDKDEMKRVLRAAGVPVAKSELATSIDEVRALGRRLGFPLIAKPPAGLGSRSTWRLESMEDVDGLPALGLTPTPREPVQVEQFVRGREHTCETVSIGGKTVWRSGTRYFPTPLEVLETPWMQYCVLLPREADGAPWRDFHPVNEAALQALFAGASSEATTALTHMEWFLADDGQLVVGEVGARPPGVHIMPMMGLAHETNFVDDWCELIAFDRFTPKPRVWAAGAAFFRGQGRGERVVSVQGLEAAVAAAGDALVEMRTPKVGMPRATGYEGEGYAIVKAKTTEAVKQALLGLVENVQVRYG
jgi:phosphoribosylaminoimidazole carboxylase (NCAIR synthetase)